MADVFLRSALPGDVAQLVADMRPLDRAEVEAMSGPRVYDNVSAALGRSRFACSAFVDGGLAAIFGVTPTSLLTSSGHPWLLGTSRMAGRGRTLGIVARRYISAVSRTFPVLFNYVDARNAPAIRFIRWLGFAIEPAAPQGVSGLPFHRFELRSDDGQCASRQPPERSRSCRPGSGASARQ